MSPKGWFADENPPDTGRIDLVDLVLELFRESRSAVAVIELVEVTDRLLLAAANGVEIVLHLRSELIIHQRR